MGMGSPHLERPLERITAALADVVATVRAARRTDSLVEERAARALEELATSVRATAVEMAKRLRETLAADRRALEIVPLDPTHIDWSPFAFFEAEYQETRWTQWLAALLRPTNGPRVALAAWRGFCSAIADACESTPPGAGDASVDAWRRAAAELPTNVTHEEAFDDGRLDLVVRAPGLVAVIENKLWADWHDSSTRRQSDAYAARGESIRREERADRLGLVLLTCRRDMDRRDRWVRLTYARLARHLRAAARDLARETSTTDLHAWVELAPLLHTIHAIESHLLGITRTGHAPSGFAFADVRRLQQALAALEVETT